MVFRRILLVLTFASLSLAVASGCFRNAMWKKDATAKLDSATKQDLLEAKPKPTEFRGATPPPIDPPRAEKLTGTTPALPGSVASAVPAGEPPVAPLGVPSTIPDGPVAPSPTAVNGTESDAEGRIRERLREWREKQEREQKEQPKPILPPEPPKPTPTVVPAPKITTPSNNVASARKLLDAANKRYSDIPDYQCKFNRRETVNGKPQAQEELLYQYRKEPMSVYMQVTGESGRGREVLYVKGQNAGKMIIITGEGDNRLIGVGKKMEFDIDSPMVMAKSRHSIAEAGMGRQLGGLGKFIEAAEKGTRPPDTVKFVTGIERREYKTLLDAIEITLQPSDDPLLPKGGKRTFFFDTDPKSQSLGLPVMVITTEGDKEVEYYSFTSFVMPANLKDADFSVDRLGKKGTR